MESVLRNSIVMDSLTVLEIYNLNLEKNAENDRIFWDLLSEYFKKTKNLEEIIINSIQF